jgi:acyl-CoA thioesterase-1
MATLPKVLISRADYQIGGGVALGLRTQEGTNIVILQPGANDLRFGFSKEQRAANIAAMVKRLRARSIRVIVFDPEIPTDFYQWDHIHFNAAAHAKIAAKLADEIAAEPVAHPATSTVAQPPSSPQP